MKNVLIADRAFVSLSIPFQQGQQNEFEKSLMREGCKEPIIVWNGVIIDGHKRYRFCCDEGIEYSVEEKKFSSEEEAISWVCRKHIPIYEMKTSAYRYLAGKLYIAQRQIYRERKKNHEFERINKLNPDWDRFSCLVADELKQNKATVESHGWYAEALDQISEKSWQLFQAILSGDIKMSKNRLQKFVSMSERKIKEYCKKQFDLGESRENTEKLRNRQKKEAHTEPIHEMPLAVGIKNRPAYDPDLELRGLTLTIPTWIMMIHRAGNQSEQATDQAKEQLSKNLKQLRTQIDELLGVINNG